jgi:hypothetical protein
LTEFVTRSTADSDETSAYYDGCGFVELWMIPKDYCISKVSFPSINVTKGLSSVGGLQYDWKCVFRQSNYPAKAAEGQEATVMLSFEATASKTRSPGNWA